MVACHQCSAFQIRILPGLGQQQALQSSKLCYRSPRSNASVVKASLEPTSDQLQNELVNTLIQYSQLSQTGSLDLPKARKSDDEILEDIKESGVKELEGIRDGIVDDLETLHDKPHPELDALICDETENMLEKTQQRQRKILDSIEQDKVLIRQNAERLRGLARKQSDLSYDTFVPSSLSLLLAFAALWYAADGFLNTSSESLRYAALDALGSGAFAYISRRKSKRQ